jgi:cyclopropane fatty-acyl-phospholipid synthase-like methyltransferase
MSADSVIDPRLLHILRCPTSGLQLRVEGGDLVSTDGSRSYPVIAGIPCLMPDSPEPTHRGYRLLLDENRKQGHAYVTEKDVAGFVQAMIVSTCGNSFRGADLAGVYPIPDFPNVFGADNILDVGCNWGRWSIAGAKAGYRLIGIDIHLKSLMCARWLSQKLTPGNEPFFVLADARHMPFAAESFGGAFSYSCIQHFSKKHAEVILSELSRVMRPQARSLIQMPNKRGIRSMVALGLRRFSDGAEFDVRYYSISDLLRLFEHRIGKSEWYVDCFLGLNVHARDRDLVPYSKRWIVDLAEVFLWASKKLPFVARFSDSVFVSSTKT